MNAIQTHSRLLQDLENLSGPKTRVQAEAALAEGRLDPVAELLDAEYPIDLYGTYPQLGDLMNELRVAISALQTR